MSRSINGALPIVVEGGQVYTAMEGENMVLTWCAPSVDSIRPTSNAVTVLIDSMLSPEVRLLVGDY
jgi:hypothetical protein